MEEGYWKQYGCLVLQVCNLSGLAVILLHHHTHIEIYRASLHMSFHILHFHLDIHLCLHMIQPKKNNNNNIQDFIMSDHYTIIYQSK